MLGMRKIDNNGGEDEDRKRKKKNREEYDDDNDEEQTRYDRRPPVQPGFENRSRREVCLGWPKILPAKVG
ncbi:hypothetical protein TWF718_000675 [Orbilia javanica]|uniref:Uncharacterized protein n=1 Tax=Orbilia javanica TaxID=47235 RepID=A0AAN8NFU3_9PEZI